MKEKDTEKPKFMGLGMQSANDTFEAMYGSPESSQVEINEEDAAVMERMKNAGSGWGDLEELPDHAADFSSLTPAELESRNQDLQYHFDKAMRTGDAESCRTALELAGSLSRVSYGNATEQYHSLELKYHQIRDKAYQEALELQRMAKRPAQYQKAYEAFQAPELRGYRDCDARAKICLGRTVKVGPTAAEDLKETFTKPKKVRVHLAFLGFEENRTLIMILILVIVLCFVCLCSGITGFVNPFIGFRKFTEELLEHAGGLYVLFP